MLRLISLLWLVDSKSAKLRGNTQTAIVANMCLVIHTQMCTQQCKFIWDP